MDVGSSRVAGLVVMVTTMWSSTSSSSYAAIRVFSITIMLKTLHHKKLHTVTLLRHSSTNNAEGGGQECSTSSKVNQRYIIAATGIFILYIS